MKNENEIETSIEKKDKENVSIWKPIKTTGDWKLFYNCNKIEENETLLEQHIKTFSEVTSTSLLKLGILVMTPKGIGKLKNLESKSATVKFVKTNEEEIFAENEVSAEFPVYIKISGNESNNWMKMFLPANGNVEGIKKLLEENKIIDSGSNYYLVYNGKELTEDKFFDQLEMKMNSKLLLVKLRMSPCICKRFTGAINQWWYISSNFDGLSFSVNKKIKLTGIGIYGSHENKTINCTVKVIEGTPTEGENCLLEDQKDVPPAPNQQECVTRFDFKKGVIIKPNQLHTVQLNANNASNNYAYVYYGSNGTSIVEGEKKVEFTFVYTAGCSTSIESGLFPEFYYLC